MNDHLAGAVAGCRLARRLASRGDELASSLVGLDEQVRRDREELEVIMAELGVRRGHAKRAAAWLGELVTRAKFARPFAEPHVGLLLELETLALGIEGKIRLWTSLQIVRNTYGSIEEARLDTLLRRARAQLDTVESARRRAAEMTLVS